MKRISLFLLAILAMSLCKAQSTFPANMPGDFKINYVDFGGEAGYYTHLEISPEGCKYNYHNGYNAQHTYDNYNFTMTKARLKSLKELYKSLLKINAFTLKGSNGEEMMIDASSESLGFEIGGKTYSIPNDHNCAPWEGEDIFSQAVQLIMDFCNKYRPSKQTQVIGI